MSDIEGLFRQIKKISQETLALANSAKSIATNRQEKAHRYLRDTRAGKAIS